MFLVPLPGFREGGSWGVDWAGCVGLGSGWVYPCLSTLEASAAGACGGGRAWLILWSQGFGWWFHWIVVSLSAMQTTCSPGQAAIGLDAGVTAGMVAL